MKTFKRILRTVSQVVDWKPDYKKLGVNSVDSLNFIFNKSGNKKTRELDFCGGSKVEWLFYR